MELFIWVEVDHLEGLNKFIKCQTASWEGEWYVTQPSYAPINKFCQVLVGYDDYIKLKDFKEANP